MKRRICIEVIDAMMAQVLKAKPGWKRLQLAHEAWALARSRLTAFLRFRHPTWSDQRITNEVARRLSCGSVPAAQTSH